MCLISIFGDNYPKNRSEVILVDSASIDGRAEFVENTWKEYGVRIIQNRKNIGWSTANNQGMDTAEGEVIVCLSAR